MKRNFTKILAAFALLVGLTIPMGVWGQTRVEESLVALTFPDDNSSNNGLTQNQYLSTWTAMIDGYSWSISNFNNNNWGGGWTYIKCGRKNNASVANITTSDAYPEAVTKVSITIDAITTSKVNSITLFISSDGSSWTSAGNYNKSTGVQTVTLANPTADQFYKIEFDCQSGSSNGLVTVSKVEYFYDNPSGTLTCEAPTFNPAAGTYTEAQNVTISCATEGATIYYTTNGDEPTTNSTVYTAAIIVSTNTTIKAMAVAEGYNNSAVATAEYTIEEPSFNQDWEGTMHGWSFVSVTGEQVWSVATTSGNHYAKMSGYASSANHENEDWCISPAFDLSEYTNPVLTFKTAKNYDGNDLVVYFSNNYDGQNLATANWQELECTLSPGGNWTFVESGNIDLSSFSGSECYIGFKYTSTTSAAATWELDDIVLAELEPSITVSTQSLNGFTYVVENGPSAAQSFTVSGENLTANIGLSLGNDSNFEICETEDGTYTNSLTLTQNNGAVSSTTIYVRLKSGLSINTYEGTITLTSTDADDKTVDLSGSVTEPVVDYATLPFEYGGGVLADFTSLNGTSYSLKDAGSYAESNAPYRIKFTQTGDYLQVKCNEQPGKVTIGVKVFSTGSNSKITVQGSADGNSFDDVEELTIDASTAGIRSLETTTGFAADHRYVRLLFTKGVNVGVGPISIALPSNEPSVTVTPDDISVDCGEHTGTLNLQALNLENYSYSITYFEADGETTTMYSWINVTFNGNGTATYNIDANTGAAQFAYFKVRANDLSGNLICYSNLVTVYQAAYEAPFEGGTYMKASGIESGKTYIIVGQDEEYAMGADRGNNRGAVGVVSDGLTITVEPGQAVYEFVIASIDDLEGYYTIYDPRNNGYLYAAGGTNNNYLKTDASANEDEEGQWAINIDSDNSIATIVANFGNEKENTQPRNTMRFNSGNNPPIFSCYGSENTMQDIYLYEKVATLTINGYTDDNSKTGYYLIASPVTFDPQYSDMTSGDFDLYYFDQNEELEWINYEDQTDGGFTLVPGKGYLYAKKATYSGETFVFPLVGEAYNESGNIELVYKEEAQFAGWNLIGNPFAEAATLDMPFYRMNEEGSDLEPVDAYNTVNAMEGVFVNAYDQELGSVTSYANFTPAGNTSGEGGMKINLTSNRGTVIDRAIVHFGEGQQLPKFQLFENSTKLYIPQGNEDYAIVRSAAQGEMPVSFRASENGTYTIAVEAENVDMNYLHLIDNMTGADVDLLATPNYTFEARTNDYTSRFRLVFSANGIDEQTAETFAFFNGTSWTVSNTGDATLQVVDITGRIISSETINGNATVSLNQPAGIYMLRLVNGNDVKVQKVVVR